VEPCAVDEIDAVQIEDKFRAPGCQIVDLLFEVECVRQVELADDVEDGEIRVIGRMPRKL
jgi:hypothetical protein